MQYRSKINQFRQKGLTLIEMVISMALIVIVFSALMPQFRVMFRSLELRQASAETLAGGRVFSDHMQRLLSQAVNITAVSPSTQTSGYIEFTGSDGSAYRCDCSDSYIRFGLAGQQQVMAGPVSNLQFTCYALSDLNTPITTPSAIDYIRVDAEFTDTTGYHQDQAISCNVLLARTPATGSWESPEVLLEFDESSGLVAGDSSGNDLDGQLHFSSPNPWCAGIDGSALNFNGSTDSVTLLDHASLDMTTEGTVCAWIYIEGYKPFAGIIHKGERPDFSDEAYTLQFWTSNYLMFAVTNRNGTMAMALDTAAPTLRQWHHVLGKWDSTGVYLYVDGVRRAWNHTAIVARNSSGALMIGSQLYTYRNSSYGIIPFYGKIDSVRIYGYALSETKIQQLAQVP